MSNGAAAWDDDQRRRWTQTNPERFVRENTHLYVRHDAARFLKPGADLSSLPRPPERICARERLQREAAARAEAEADAARQAAEWEQLQRELDALTMQYEEVKREFLDAGHGRKYSPNQQRVPAGNPDGGQWTMGGGGAGSNDPRVLSDATPDNDWKPGAQYAADGHHTQPRANYKDLPLPPETRKVFDQASSGKLHVRGHEFNEFHRRYNAATKEVTSRFMQEHDITPERMTPDQARALLREIETSEDPRIRTYREMIRRLQQFYRLRTGGGRATE